MKCQTGNGKPETGNRPIGKQNGQFHVSHFPFPVSQSPFERGRMRKSTVSNAGIQVWWWFPARRIPAFEGSVSFQSSSPSVPLPHCPLSLTHKSAGWTRTKRLTALKGHGRTDRRGAST